MYEWWFCKDWHPLLLYSVQPPPCSYIAALCKHGHNQIPPHLCAGQSYYTYQSPLFGINKFHPKHIWSSWQHCLVCRSAWQETGLVPVSWLLLPGWGGDLLISFVFIFAIHVLEASLSPILCSILLLSVPILVPNNSLWVCCKTFLYYYQSYASKYLRLPY